MMLGVRPGPGLRIALENPMRADTLFLERAAIEINERVRLISADEELDAELDITEAGVGHVLGLSVNGSTTSLSTCRSHWRRRSIR